MATSSQNNHNHYTNYFQRDNVLFFICIFIIGIYFFPYFFAGQNAKLLIHDNLDANIVWVKLFLENGSFFSSPSAAIDQVFNGLSRASIYATYDFDIIVFKFLGIYWGYVFNKVCIAIFAFIGMYFLLKKHFLSKDSDKIILFGVALLFSLLPFWSFSMSVSGLPVLLYAFLNLRKKQTHFTDWLIILLFPFCSSLITSGIFFIVLVSGILVRDSIKYRIVNLYMLLGLCLLTLMYCVSHFPILYSFVFSSQNPSHRLEFKSAGVSLMKSIKMMGEIFFKGHYHAHSLHTLIIIPIVLGAILMFRKKMINKRYIIIFLFIFFTSLFYGFIEWDKVQPFVEKLLVKIPIQLQRFHWLHPMFWYVLLAISLCLIGSSLKVGKYVVSMILLFQLAYIFWNHELIINRKGPSFKQFYAEKNFEAVEKFIGKPKNSYRVISVGMQPAIAIYNGFYTLDGYFATYPLQYKHEFRKIIANELEKDSNLKNYFDDWGSRCYAFSAEVGLNFNNPELPEIQHLEFDYNQLKKMGGEFIISSTPINLENNNRIKFLKTFSDSDSYWKVHLYSIQ